MMQCSASKVKSFYVLQHINQVNQALTRLFKNCWMSDGLFHVAAKSCIIFTKLQLTSSCQSAILGVVTRTRLTALFRDYPGEPVPER